MLDPQIGRVLLGQLLQMAFLTRPEVGGQHHGIPDHSLTTHVLRVCKQLCFIKALSKGQGQK